jgi:hypothetical protein
MIEKNISSENTFTIPVPMYGEIDLSIAGTFEGTLTLQRSFDGGNNWRNVDTFTTSTETYFYEPKYDVYYRIGFKTGDYSSGTAEIIIHD